MADTPPNPHVSDEQSDGAPDPRHNPPYDGRQSNGEASAGQAEMEDWDELEEGEQDDPATDYYALLNVPRDVLGPLPPHPTPPLHTAMNDAD